MINPRSTAILIRDGTAIHFEDKTRDIADIRVAGQLVEIKFNKSYKKFGYSRDRVRILDDPQRRALAEGERVEANGSTWETATEVLTFADVGGAWTRIFYQTRAGEDYRTYPASQVRVIASAADAPAVAGVLRYWRAVTSRLSRDDPLRIGYSSTSFTLRARSAHS